MTHLTNISTQKRKVTDLHLETLLNTLDDLHTAVTNGNVSEETTLSREELLGWLEDIVYTAQETINELEDEQVVVEETAHHSNIASLSVIQLYSRG